jgi:hypothetical protein
LDGYENIQKIRKKPGIIVTPKAGQEGGLNCKIVLKRLDRVIPKLFAKRKRPA